MANIQFWNEDRVVDEPLSSLETANINRSQKQPVLSLYLISSMVSIDTIIFDRLVLTYGTPLVLKEKVTGKTEPLVLMHNPYLVYFLYGQRTTYQF